MIAKFVVVVFLFSYGCRTRIFGERTTDSAPKISNGVLGSEFRSHVFYIDMGRGENPCTATCVSPTVTLTAAHCFYLPGSRQKFTASEATLVQRYDPAKVSGENVWVYPGYNDDDTFGDLAVVRWSKVICPNGHARISLESIQTDGNIPKEDTPVMIAGNGLSSDNCNGFTEPQYRVGSNSLAWTNGEAGMIWGYNCPNAEKNDGDKNGQIDSVQLGIKQGEKAVTQGGDSGGPLFIDGKIAGVLHGGGTYDKWPGNALFNKEVTIPPEWANNTLFKFSTYTMLSAEEIKCFLHEINVGVPGDEKKPGLPDAEKMNLDSTATASCGVPTEPDPSE